MKYSKLLISVCCLSSFSAFSQIEWQTNQGLLKLYGDVEFNIDAASKKHALTSLKTSIENNEDKRWDINGRVLIGLDGQSELENHNYAGFSVQPLANLSGDVNLDDAVLYFGNQHNWQMKVGRFEAYDMFPLGQDTFIEYSGNTANDLYSDGYGYIYMMKEARGRTSHGGSILLNKSLGNFTLELNTMVQDGSQLFDNKYYHGYSLKNNKNTITLRPVISWKTDNISFAGAIESNVVKDAYGYNDSNGDWQDTSKRTGYGLTMSWNSHGHWNATGNNLVVNLSTAYLDAEKEKDFTAGINTIWNGIGLGYVFAANDIKQFNPDVATTVFGEKGKYKLHTINTSYLIPHVMDMDNFNIYVGAYWSHIERDERQGGGSDNRYGARVRLKYHF